MRRARTAGTLLAAAAMLIALGSPVEAQSRHHSGHPSTHGGSYYSHSYRGPTYHRYYRPAYRSYYRPYYRPSVRFYGYLGYPYYYSPYYWPSFGLYYGYPGAFYPGYSYPYYYGYGGYGPDRGWASVRIEVKPKQAKVYVDGYYAGVVDDYDGTFQRLNVPPGNHVITVYLEGYRSIEQTLYFSPDSSFKIKQEMIPLAAGEAQEPPPQPPEGEAPEPPEGQEAGPGGSGMVMPPVVTTPQGESAPPAQAPPAAITSAPASDFGVLEVRVQPEGVRLLIDGEPWPTAEPTGPISIHLAQGRHRVEIDKAGYQSFSGEVVVSSGRTTTLNVKLSSSTERRDQSSLSVSRRESR